MNVNFNPAFKAQYKYSTNKQLAQPKFDTVSFGSTTRIGGPGRQNTTAVRDDLDWGGLAERIINDYKNKSRVNIFSFACSDGTEPYAVAINLLKKIEEEQHKLYIVFKNKQTMQQQKEKFLPIYASDIDPFMIENCCESGLLGLYPKDVEKLGQKNLDRFLTKTDKALTCPPQWGEKGDEIRNYQISDELKEAVKFRVGDMLKDIRTIKDEGNSVVMCRNVLPHLGFMYHEVVTSVSRALKKGSLFVIGDYDTKEIPGLKNTLEIYDFKEIQRNVFRKIRDF